MNIADRIEAALWAVRTSSPPPTAGQVAEARYPVNAGTARLVAQGGFGDRDAGMWVLAATTGMRRSELAGTERGLLDLDAATLDGHDTRVVVDGKAEDSNGKTER